MATSPQKKDQSIEALRGIAIVLLVTYHCRGVATEGTDGTDWYSYFSYSFDFVRMPLFTVISGFVYAIRPVQPGKLLAFAHGKARRILLPFFCVYTTWVVLNLLFPVQAMPMNVGTPADPKLIAITKEYLRQPQTYWFLQAVFQVFLIVAVLERFELLATVRRWAACLLVASLAAWMVFAGDGEDSVIAKNLEWFSWGRVAYLLPYFLLGVALNRFSATLLRATFVSVAALVFLAGMLVHQLIWYGVLPHIDNNKFGSPVAIVVGLTGILLMFRFRFDLPLLAKLGYYSFPIYLFHRFGFEAAYAAREYGLLPGNNHVLFAVFATAGLLLPIPLERLLLRSQTLSLMFLGVRPKEEKAAQKKHPSAAATEAAVPTTGTAPAE